MIHANRLYSFDYLCGWRYLLSADYRHRVQQRWGGNPLTRLMCATGAMLGMVFTGGLAVLAVMAVASLLA